MAAVVARFVVGLLTMGMLAAAMPGVSAQADPVSFADLPYTVIVTDAQDHVGFLDVREVALAEPGDATLVARFKVQDFSIQAGTESFHFFMTTPKGSFRAGFGASGSPSTHSSSVAGFASCAVEGSTVYCVLPYEAIEAEVGDSLTGTYVITYQQGAQDFAPGGYFESSVLGNRGDDYTLTGGPAPAVVAEVLAFEVEANATVEGSGAVVFSVGVANRGEQNATVNLTVANSTGGLELVLENSTVTVAGNSTVAVNATVTVPEGTAPGAYTWMVRADGANGGNATVELSLTVLAAPEAGPSEDGNGTAGNASAEDEVQEGDAGIPGPALPLVVVALAAALLVLRRRRA